MVGVEPTTLCLLVHCSTIFTITFSYYTWFNLHSYQIQCSNLILHYCHLTVRRSSYPYKYSTFILYSLYMGPDSIPGPGGQSFYMKQEVRIAWNGISLNPIFTVHACSFTYLVQEQAPEFFPLFQFIWRKLSFSNVPQNLRNNVCVHLIIPKKMLY